MLKKRIIPCLDVKNGRTVKGVGFVNLCDAGDSVELAKKYSLEGADELVFLDISATDEKRKTMADFAKKVAQKISIPFTIGGGISSIEDAKAVILAGADKIAINSSAVKNPKLITDLSENFGAQAVVVAIDAKKDESKTENFWEVFVSGGKMATGKNVVEWALEAEKLGAGEILLTSIDQDGAKNGFDILLLQAVCEKISIPVVASGGAGKMEDFLEVFEKTNATGALAASVFHFNEISLLELKNFLTEKKIPVRRGE